MGELISGHDLCSLVQFGIISHERVYMLLQGMNPKTKRVITVLSSEVPVPKLFALVQRGGSTSFCQKLA
eukprot:SAG11_NODE_4117_length_2059_cov_1.364796_3_plen_69_part_00